MEFEYFSDYGLWLFIKYKYAQLHNIFIFPLFYYMI
jgi:hypothetical protein